MNVAIFWDIAPCSPYVMEAICSSKILIHIQITWQYSQEDGNIHNYRFENLKSYKPLDI
jgi:hypothetical protein